MMILDSNFHVTSASSSKEFTTTHESGMKLTVHFCDNCGATVYKTADRDEFRGLVVLLAGTLDDPAGLQTAKPQQELYTKYRVPWLPEVKDVIQKEGF
jgi:hypothetical protein